MNQPWRTVRIFISSTFRDMHAERDWLVKRVFPALREKLEPHRVHLVDIDLRWGITEEQAHQDQVLDVCLNTIDECRPYFLGLLGERYGWVPNAENLPSEMSKHGWTQQQTGKSVTELEIRWGVLLRSEMRNRALFFFRDPTFSQDIPAAKRPDVEAEDAESFEKLRMLKAEILAANLPLKAVVNYPCRYAGLRINWRLLKLEADLTDTDRQALESIAADGLIDNSEYEQLSDHLKQIVQQHGIVYLSGLEEFGRQVHDRLWQALQNQLQLTITKPAETTVDPLAEEQGYHERFMETRRRVYVGRQNLLSDLMTFATGNGEVPCLVTAPSGAGKSAALARFVELYSQSHPRSLVIPHFIGASPTSTNLRLILYRFCLTLNTEFQFVDHVPPDTNSLITLFRKFVSEVPSDRRVVLVIDALNQLDEAENAHHLFWLPWQWPAHVKLVASCIADPQREEPVLQAFQHRKVHRISVQPLSNAERSEIVQAVPSLSAKTLDSLQVGLLLANPATENPLFLLVALEELRGFGSFDQIDHRIAQFPLPTTAPASWAEWLAKRRADAEQMADADKRHRDLRRLNRLGPALLRNSPVADPLTAIFLQVIDRLEGDFAPKTVQAMLPLLASARRGLSDREFLDLLEGPTVPIPDSQSDLFPVLRQLRSYLQHRGTLWDFFHRNLFKAVRFRYLDTEERQSQSHAQLITYFQSQDYFLESLEEQRARAQRIPPTPRPVNIRKVDELPWQMLQVAKLSGREDPQSPHWDAIADLFSDLHFLEAKAEATR